MSAISPVAFTLGGQIVWAVAQAATIIILSNQSHHAIVGLFTLGLAIFAPICLIGSLNLRTSIAIDWDQAISPVDAFLLRAGVISLALLVTNAVIYCVSETVHDWLIAMTLVAVRAADQLSDVAIGFYQRDGKNRAIARSFLVRGVGGVFPFVFVIGLGGGILFAAFAALIATIAISIIFDVAPFVVGNYSSLSLRTTVRQIGAIMRQTIWVAPYPALDNLHFNSFRYAMFLATSTEFMGLVGVAQTLFVPFQLLATAIGLNFLPEARRIAGTGDTMTFRAHVLRGLAFGLAVSVSFLLCALIGPHWAFTLIYAERVSAAQSVTVLVAAAMLPVIACGFTALCLVARGNHRAYSTSPVIGLIVFWGVALAAFRSEVANPSIIVAGAFFASAVVRLIFATTVSNQPFASKLDPQTSTCAESAIDVPSVPILTIGSPLTDLKVH